MDRRVKGPARDLGADCLRCPLRRAPLVLPPKPSKTAELIIIGEGPGKSEVALDDFFVGPSGDLLDDMLEEFGTYRGRCHMTNATLCEPSGWGDVIEEAADCCRPRLVRELNQTSAKVILTYGQESLRAVTGKSPVKNWMGAPLHTTKDIPKKTVIGTYHPAYVLRPDGSPHAPAVWVHTKRAIDLSKNNLPDWKWPRILVSPDKKALQALERFLDTREEIGFDIETRGTDPLHDLCGCIGIAGARTSVCVPWEEYRSGKLVHSPPLTSYTHGPMIAKRIKQILAHKNIDKVAHNATHDVLGCERLGMKVNGYIHDTLSSHALVMPGSHHDLGFACCVETHAPRWKTEFHATTAEKGTEAFFKRDPFVLRTYCAKDAWMGRRLKRDLVWQLETIDPDGRLMANYDTLLPITIDMTRHGVRRDEEAVKAHRVNLGRRVKRALEQVREVAALVGYPELNPNSTPQVQALFFGRLGVRPTRWSDKTGKPSCNSAALTDNLTSDNPLVVAFCRSMLRYRKYDKLMGYLNDKHVTDKGIIHVDWKFYGARTARWSSSPNLQNIAKPELVRRKKANKKIGAKKGSLYVRTPGLRNIFVPHKKGDWMVAADYDQIELKLIAMLANDGPLMEVFYAGGDPHRHAAADLFNCRPEDVQKNERDMAKIAQYLIWYGGGYFELFKQIMVEFPNYSLGAARMQHANYIKAHRVEEYHEEALDRARESKCIEFPLSGRKLYIFGGVDPSKVYNLPVQGSAAEIINPAVPKIAAAVRGRERLLMQVHDELVCEGPNPIRVAKKLKKAMEKSVTINEHTLFFSAGIKVGPSYGELVEQEKGESLDELCSRVAKEYKGRLTWPCR